MSYFLVPWSVWQWGQIVFEHEVGLWNWLGRPGQGWPSMVSAVLIFDFFIYLQHRLFHKVPLLWRFHRVHHSDEHLDASSALRFHPLEIYLSTLFKLVIITLWGFPPESIFWFEVILSSCALFNHANLYLPPKVEGALSLFLITPDLHRLHHSQKQEEHQSNFGFNVPWWDYLLGTHRKINFKDQEKICLGVNYFLGKKKDHFIKLLIQPFKF